MIQGGPRGSGAPAADESADAVLISVIRSVAYRLREEYLKSPRLFNSTEAIAWAVANLEYQLERIEDAGAPF